MNNIALSAAGVTKMYGTQTALQNVSIDFIRGTSTAIMGSSGSGKTTLLHTLAGIIQPDSGSVQYREHTLASLTDAELSKLRRTDFGFVFQQGLLLPELTAQENVALPLMLNGTSKSKSLPVAQHWLAALGLAGLGERRIAELSGGQQQRVAIARAQVFGAKIIFADEPTGALDSQTSTEVMQALTQSTTAEGRTLIVVTHDAEVAAHCNRTLHMQDGGILTAPPAQPRS